MTNLSENIYQKHVKVFWIGCENVVSTPYFAPGAPLPPWGFTLTGALAVIGLSPPQSDKYYLY